ncbi:terminase large subunit domain-containing protein [Methanobrevibacter sp.]|uniref:terminase large subunit domain-containing protein n=1 Tax=Methanobrevibacter sp. TaxID=66852 RepID=UPI00388D79DB
MPIFNERPSDDDKPVQIKSTKDAINISKSRTRAFNIAIKNDVQSKLKDLLLSPDENGLTFYEDFLSNYLELARTEPNSKAAEIIAKTCLQEDLLDQLDKSLEQSMLRNQDFLKFRIIQTLFDKQRDVLLDNLVRRKCIICSRRAGKTQLAIRQILYTCVVPKSPCFYINLTFGNAIEQIWGKDGNIVESAEEIGLPIQKTDKTNGYIEFVNGSTVKISGNNNANEIEKFRGFKARLVIIDECQSQRNLNYLVDDIISPLMMDYADSLLVLQGTPPRSPHHPFEDLFMQYKSSDSPKNKAYTWNIYNNPYIPNVKEEIEDLCKRKGLNIDSPLIQREYLGNVGVYDTEAQVFKNYTTFENGVINDDMQAPRDYESYIPKGFIADHIYIGNDYGWAAYNSVIGLACNTQTRECFIFYEHKFSKASVTDIVNSNKKCLEIGRKILMRNPQCDLSKIAIFGDTSDNSIIWEMVMTYKLPAYKCYKYNKDMAISQLSEELRTGRIAIPKGGILAQECDRILYRRDEYDAILNEIDDDVFHPDAMFALLYASRQYFFDIKLSVGGEGGSL